MEWSHIVVEAPVRAADLGGWTDTWFAGSGCVTNVAVGPGVRVDVRPAGSQGSVVVLESLGESFEMDDPRFAQCHPVAHAVISAHPPSCPVRIVVSSQVPPGSGLGTSAAVTVALLAAMLTVAGTPFDAAELAAEAHRLETGTGIQSGVQDHAAAAVGGVCRITVDYPRFQAEQLAVDSATLQSLELRLVTVYFGRPHHSSDIHRAVIQRLESADPNSLLEPLRMLAGAAAAALSSGDMHAYHVAIAMSMAAQRALDQRLICRDADRLAEICALSGGGAVKVNGAGGDGGSASVLLPADPKLAASLVEAIAAEPGWRILPLRATQLGVTVTVT